MTRFTTLADWLAWQETLHPNEIELGLQRVHSVLQRMQRDHPDYTVITVAGTNGKGSSVAMLNAIYQAAGYRVGAYTSPHFSQYNERICLQGEPVSDEELCAAFDRVERCRQDIPLTYFEFGTLAAIEIFACAQLDIVIMEVGLGGRLDAVNCIDANIALITAIGVDHEQWLGTNRERIAVEKAGIARAGRDTVCSDVDAPASLIAELGKIQSKLYLINRDYHYALDPLMREDQAQTWHWWWQQQRRNTLNLPAMRGAYQLQNAAGVLMVLALLQRQFPISQANVREGLARAVLPGRFQARIVSIDRQQGAGQKQILHIYDVAHNPSSAKVLAETAGPLARPGKTHAVFAILQDKDIAAVISAVQAIIDHWYVADLQANRAATAADIAKLLKQQGVNQDLQCYASIKQALHAAQGAASNNDRIIIFGSFYTVSEAQLSTDPQN